MFKLKSLGRSGDQFQYLLSLNSGYVLPVLITVSNNKINIPHDNDYSLIISVHPLDVNYRATTLKKLISNRIFSDKKYPIKNKLNHKDIINNAINLIEEYSNQKIEKVLFHVIFEDLF